MYESSSSDGSDHAERYKNVENLLVKSDEYQRNIDENYAYKQKLGDLIFDASFEGGNLGGVRQINTYEFDLNLRPDVSNTYHSVWFNFRVSNQRPNQCIILHFTNLSEKLPLLSEVGLSPVARSRLEPNWVRLKREQVFYYRAPDKGNKYQLSVAFRFSYQNDEHQFALFYPYTLSTLENFLTRWTVHLKRCELRSESSVRNRDRMQCKSTEPNLIRPSRTVNKRAKTPTRCIGRSTTPASSRRCSNQLMDLKNIARFRVDVLTRSALSKPIYELTVSSRVPCEDDRSFVVIIGRASAGNFESASSIVCQGLLDFMLSDDVVATAARDHINLVTFPMLDPDSLWVGNGKTDLMGQRDISLGILEANQTLYANYRLAIGRIRRICETSRKSTIIIELRVNPNLIGARVIGTHYHDSIRMERHLQLPRLLSRFTDGFYLEKCKFVNSGQDSERLFKSFVQTCNIESYRLEVSPFGYHKRSLVDDQYEEYDQMKYLLLGKSIAFSLITSLKRKDAELPKVVREQLKMFQKTPQDIDDLILFQS